MLGEFPVVMDLVGSVEAAKEAKQQVFHRKIMYLNLYLYMYLYLYLLGCSKETLFQNKNKRNPPRINLGVSLKGSKRIFDFDQVQGHDGQITIRWIGSLMRLGWRTSGRTLSWTKCRWFFDTAAMKHEIIW